MRNRKLAHDFDGFWKTALDQFLVDFLALGVPDLAAAIDPHRAIVSLAQELHAIAPRNRRGRRTVDRAFKVPLRTGGHAVVVLHVEIQGQRDPDFPRRMFVYKARLMDRHEMPVLSVAILADRDAHWRPDRFEVELFGDRLLHQFRVVKTEDFRVQVKRLERSQNPFAIVLLAHLHTRSTRPDARRLQFKIQLTRRLLRRDFSRQQIVQLYRLLDWILLLPEPLERVFETVKRKITKETRMEILSNAERRAMRQGRIKGRSEGRSEGWIEATIENTLTILRARFRSVPDAVSARLAEIRDREVLMDLLASAAISRSVAAFRRRLPKNGAT